ncbi:MAG TPA: outer membrane protein assembly factor BamA [Gemmatimonadales bacterium]|nr:outer membrane protein assembly factor BamA [Gemmatimonadales bacterium]
MRLRFAVPALLAAVLSAAPLAAQDPGAPRVDSLTAEGNARVSTQQILTTAAILPGATVNYRDIQRAVTSLYRTGQFDDVTVVQRIAGGRNTLVFVVKERPLLAGWSIRGAERVSTADVRDRVKLLEGRPIDRAALARSTAAIDSLYRDRGYYTAEVTAIELPADSTGGVRVFFDIREGGRVALSQVTVEGNQAFSDGEVVAQMGSKPESFWWFRSGEYDERQVEDDMRDRLPRWYASRGHIDFQVTGDTLIADSAHGKATLQLTVDEGPVYRVGAFEIRGNRRYSTDELMAYYPFTASAEAPFNRGAWESATGRLGDLYANSGYIYAQIVPQETRRTLPDGSHVIDLAWNIQEGRVATVNKINIVGNDVTHERVIREAIVLFPGQVFNRDALVRSYQNVGNIGFFQQPMAPPSVDPAANGVDVDITFRVEERRTGNINFGASLGQGTGVGGFLGLEEPNLFGRGKRGRLQWQFGTNINDFTLSYTDPAIRESRISGTVSVYDSRQRFTVRDLGRRRQTGGSLQLGFPFLGSRYTRVFGSYGIQRIRYSEGSSDIQERFICNNCVRSTLGLTLLRDTRVGLPFATGGAQTSITGELNGGFLGGTGDYRKVDVEGRWYAPLGTLGGGGQQFGGGVQFVLGFSARSGFIFGDASNFFTELYSLGGVQFGVPLRGYEEFAITPNGFDPEAGGTNANPEAFGKSFATFTVEAGARISQSLYASLFMDAGNVYRTARQWDPTRLYRGAGIGVALVSPLGPIGVDFAYGFDRVDAAGKPNPGWQLHFKVGNFF